MKSVPRIALIFVSLQFLAGILVFGQTSECNPLDNPCRLREISQAIGNGNKTGALHVQRGYLYSSMGEYRKATVDFGHAIGSEELASDLLAKAFTARAICFDLLGFADEAIRDFTLALAIEPTNPQLLFLRGRQLTAIGSYDRSLQDLTNAIVYDPKNSELINYRGNVYVWRQERKKAFIDFNRAIELDPNNPYAYFNRAYEYNYRKEYHKAIADFTKFIELNGKLPWTLARAHRYRASSHEELGNKQQALSDFNSAVALEPNTPGYYRSRAAYFRRQGMKDLAQADEAKAIALLN